MYTATVSPDRRYQLQSDEANRRLDALLETLRVPEASWRAYSELLTTTLKMLEDRADLGDLKIASAALKEIRYGFKVFAPYRHVPKITVFGSARTAADHPVSRQAQLFGRRMTEAGWMVITGAGSGVMGAAQEGAGGERSFGLNIRLPFEQEANPWIADDPKLISFKYFFTRKLFLVREAHAMAFFPGGFGTGDEVFETLTLVQTGKAPVLPIVLVDAPGGSYWKHFQEFVGTQMVETGMISRGGHLALARHRRRRRGGGRDRAVLPRVPLPALRGEPPGDPPEPGAGAGGGDGDRRALRRHPRRAGGADGGPARRRGRGVPRAPAPGLAVLAPEPGPAPPADRLPQRVLTDARPLARMIRGRDATLTPTLSLAEGEGVCSIPSPPEGERARVRGRAGRGIRVRE